MPELRSMWVASADMGYGHQRAAYPFREPARNGILNAGATPFTSEMERAQWKRYLKAYEGFSRAKGIPVIGKPVFNLLDRLLHIPSLYPIRNLSDSTYQVDMLYRQIKKGLGKGLVQTISQDWQPLLTSFYVPAIAADLAGYEKIFSIICDADLNRVWVAKEPWDSNINYFAPCGKAAMRLKSYGVPEERIYLTGFPLDDALLGGRDLTTLKHDLAIRLKILDPLGRFRTSLGSSVDQLLGDAAQTEPPADRVLTITYAVGGAGAQADIGVRIMRSFAEQLRNGEMQLNLVAGTRPEVRDTFEEAIEQQGMQGARVEVLYRDALDDYFRDFNTVIRSTDILWTKPSELSFYAGLGLPIIMCPTIGSQEKFNRRWLQEIGAGMRQEKPDHADEWLVELLKNGRFADMAWLGFLRARKLGTYHILDVLETGTFERSDHPLAR